MKERLTLEEENQKTLERMTPEEEYQSAIENIGAVICFLGFVWCGMSANVITLVAGMCICAVGAVAIMAAAPVVRMMKKREGRKRSGRGNNRIKACENAERTVEKQKKIGIL